MSILMIRRWAHRILLPVVIVLVLALTVGLFYIGVPGALKETTAYTGPSAKVNGEKIKDKDFNEISYNVTQKYGQYGFSESMIRDETLNQAIQQLAFQQELRKERIRVSGSEIDALLKQAFPTEEELQNFMDSRNLSKGDLRKLGQKQLEQKKFYLAKAKEFKIKVPDALIDSEFRRSFQQITVSHVLVATVENGKPLRSNAAALTRANEVYAKVASGADFAKLVLEYSDDPGSKQNGGKYGPMNVGEFAQTMVKEFTTAALALKPGGISRPVKSEFGYHIIKLDAMTLPTGSDAKDKKTEIREALLISQLMEGPRFKSWWEKVMRTANSTSNLEVLDPGLRAYRLNKQGKFKEAAQAYEKATGRKYYKKRWDFYLEAAQNYLQLKQPKEAIKIVNRIAKDFQDHIDVQLMLAGAYKADSKPVKAIAILTTFSKAHPDEKGIHEQLKGVFKSWNRPDLMAGEDAYLAEIARKDAEAQQTYLQNLLQKTGPSPVPST
jgi:foldase protein PrsA